MNPRGQNWEDLYVWEVIGHQGLTPPKLVVDIGAADGQTFSNSRLFIENGWRGVLVEPYAPNFAKLVALYQNTPGVMLCRVAVADYDGTGKMVQVGDTLQTRFIAAADGDIEVVSVKRFWSQNIHAEAGLLTIDTEGMDGAILRQLLQETVARPWFIIAESLTQRDRTLQLEVTKHDYHLLTVRDLNLIWVRRDIAAKWIPVE